MTAGAEADDRDLLDGARRSRCSVTCLAVGSGSKKLRHPQLGPVSYSHVVLQVADNPDQTFVTYSPATGRGNTDNAGA